MDSPPFRVVRKPAERVETRVVNDLTVFSQLNAGSVSEEQPLPVLTRRDDRSAVSRPDPPAGMGIYTHVVEAPSQKRSTPTRYTPTSDTESEGVIIRPPDASRKPGKVFPTPGPVYAKPANTDNRRKISVYSSTESDVTDYDSDDDDNYTTSEIQRLKDQIQDLEEKREQRNSRAVQQRQPQSEPSRYQILYRLGYEVRPDVLGTTSDEYSSDSDSDEPYRRGNNWYMYPPGLPRRNTKSLNTFTDSPVLTHDRWGGASLHSTHRVDSLRHFLKSNPDISFIVFHDYNWFQKVRAKKPEPSHEDMDNSEEKPTPRARSIYPVSKELRKALEMILEDREGYSSLTSRYWNTNELFAPYLFIFHSRQDIPKIREKLSKPAQDQLDLFLEYVMKEFGEEYKTVDTLLQRKEILPQYLQYLIKKDDILVENKNGEYTGYRAESWPVESIRPTPNPLIATKYGMPGNEYESPHESGVSSKWTLNGFTWGFDGKFYGRWKQLKIEMYQDSGLEEAAADSTKTVQLKGQPITNLAVFPLCYAPEHIQKMLYHRGDILWKCRARQLVSYQANDQDLIGNAVSLQTNISPKQASSTNQLLQMEEHYMIDMKTYQSLHPKNTKTSLNTVYRPPPPPPKKLLSKKKMTRNDPPGDDFKVLMPPRIKGYDFHRNKWCDLNVDQISEVVWRGGASAVFHTLQIDYEAKDLIQALVTNYLGIEKSTAVAAGKGNGLTILLHGGPGTGKTHTAEAIAEIAKKPLYRVSCGDLGTKTDVVEQNLESAFHLARTWGSVVLLEEADIFLEQTSLGDLERSALTSVFLRMVKSYDGIVILEGSRVSKFNDAARSQIQLALHYPALSSLQRYFIWKQFFLQLEFSKMDADISDLLEHVEDLRDQNLNGREIQNVLVNACRYAKWKKVPLNSYHIKHMIEVSGRFGTFFGNCDGGDAQDEMGFDEWLH